MFDRTQQYYEAYVSRHIKYPFEKPKKAFFASAYGSNDKRGVEMMQAITADIFSHEYKINRNRFSREYGL
ncbi:MAG: hypothetical protein ACLR13_00400 [Acutalibacteraceae bacterium]